MSAQQQWLQKFTDNDYNRLSEQVETVSESLPLLSCVMVRLRNYYVYG